MKAKKYLIVALTVVFLLTLSCTEAFAQDSREMPELPVGMLPVLAMGLGGLIAWVGSRRK